MKRRNYLSIVLVLVILLSSFQLTVAADLENLIQYNMTIDLNTDKNTIEGKQNISFTNPYNDELKDLVFHLYADSYNSYETFPAIGGMYFMDEEIPELPEEQKGDIKIHKVNINGRKVKYTEDNQILKIPLEKPLRRGEKINIQIDFTLKIPEGSHRLHYMKDSYSLTNWYPILSVYDEKTKKWNENPYHPIGESNYSDVSDYNVKLIVPKEMVVVPTGTIVNEKVLKDNKVVAIKAEKVRDFVIIMNPNYKMKTKEVDGIKISNYYIDDTKAKYKEKTADIILDEVAKTVKFVNKTIGKYPYDELRIAETYLSGGAMEYPQVLQMGMYSDLSYANIEENAPFLIEAAVHETIHQWWYVGVGNNMFKEPFLDESLTVFTTAYYFEKVYDKYHQNGVDYTIRSYLYETNTLPLNSSVDEFQNWGDYSETIYTRGPAFFEDLRQRVGEDKFIKILRTYYERFLYKNATIEDLLEVIEEVAGKEIRKIMDKAIKEPNYTPQNIELTDEERDNFYKIQEHQRLKKYEKANGLGLGSIILRGLEGEELILVKPDYIKDEDILKVEDLTMMLSEDLKIQFDIETKIVEEKKLKEEDKKNNLIIVGYPKKSSLMKEIGAELPIDLYSETIDINGISIKNQNVSGIFISENPINNKKLSLIIFLDENDTKKETITTPDEHIADTSLIYQYNPLYNADIQFRINAGDVEIRGLYK